VKVRRKGARGRSWGWERPDGTRGLGGPGSSPSRSDDRYLADRIRPSTTVLTRRLLVLHLKFAWTVALADRASTHPKVEKSDAWYRLVQWVPVPDDEATESNFLETRVIPHPPTGASINERIPCGRKIGKLSWHGAAMSAMRSRSRYVWSVGPGLPYRSCGSCGLAQGCGIRDLRVVHYSFPAGVSLSSLTKTSLHTWRSRSRHPTPEKRRDR